MPWDGDRAVGRRGPGRTARRQRARGSPAGRDESISSRSGRRTACSTSSPTAPAGGTSTAGADGGDRAAPRRWRPSSGRPQWSLRHVDLRLRRSADRLVCGFVQRRRLAAGAARPARRSASTRSTRLLHEHLARPRGAGPGACSSAGSPSEPPALVELDLASGQSGVVRRSAGRSATASGPMFSRPEPIEFPTEGGRDRPRLLLSAAQPRLRARRPARRPPLLVMSHGGPTVGGVEHAARSRSSTGPAAASPCSTSTTAAAPATAAPIASGSNGQWGVVDVDDCVNGARYLVAARPDRRARWRSRGGSAGGYTTLCALTFRDVFKAGASYYGISDLEALARDTHKFESRYLDRLIGPYPRGAATLPRALADPPRRPPVVPGDLLPGPRGQGRAAEPGRGDGRRRSRPGACRSPTSRSPASSTASARPRTSSARSTPSCISTPCAASCVRGSASDGRKDRRTGRRVDASARRTGGCA